MRQRYCSELRARVEPACVRDLPSSGLTSGDALLALAEFRDDVLECRDHLVSINPGLGKSEVQLERLGWSSVAENVCLGPAGLWPSGFFPDGLASNCALTGHFLDQGDHF